MDATPNASALPRVALVLGDAMGIGPEQCARVLSDGRLRDAARIVVIGDGRVLEQGMRDAEVSLAWPRWRAPRPSTGLPRAFRCSI